MDANLKTKWIEALRSGRYRQARSQLQRDDAFCCLGVLCLVASAPIRYSVLDEKLGLPYETRRKCEILNDSHEKSFPEIADWIEKNPQLFAEG